MRKRLLMRTVLVLNLLATAHAWAGYKAGSPQLCCGRLVDSAHQDVLPMSSDYSVTHVPGPHYMRTHSRAVGYRLTSHLTTTA